MSLTSEFRSFIQRGNVIDLAVGVVIGASFGKIVNSLVTDVLMPPVGFLIGGVNFTEIKIHLADLTAGKADVTLNVGNFFQSVSEFIIVAFCVFLVVRTFNRLKSKEAPAPPPGPSNEEKLLTEIRDLLKK
ncbi:MAG: large-conductance mechanosensitive channel protein MscL [Bacteroidota bacterium]